MVASALFTALRQALDRQALSDTAIQAWRSAYDQLANILIRLQKELPNPAL
jgi:hemoglobin-like flavoprotein